MAYSNIDDKSNGKFKQPIQVLERIQPLLNRGVTEPKLSKPVLFCIDFEF